MKDAAKRVLKGMVISKMPHAKVKQSINIGVNRQKPARQPRGVSVDHLKDGQGNVEKKALRTC